MQVRARAAAAHPAVGSRTPKNDVHSAPEYVVGTETSGRPVAADAALPVSIALPPPIATIVSTPSGTSIRCDGTSSQRSAASSTPRQRGLATTNGRSPASAGQLVDAPADDHPASLRARELDERVRGARGVRPDARTSEISRFASSPSTRAAVSVPAASSGSTAEREMNVTP